MLNNTQMPAILLQTMAWSLGEYAFLLTKDPDPANQHDLATVVEKLCGLARQTTTDTASRRYLVLAVMKLVSQLGTCPGVAARLIDSYTKSRDVFLQQSCLEFQVRPSHTHTHCVQTLLTPLPPPPSPPSPC